MTWSAAGPLDPLWEDRTGEISHVATDGNGTWNVAWFSGSGILARGPPLRGVDAAHDRSLTTPAKRALRSDSGLGLPLHEGLADRLAAPTAHRVMPELFPQSIDGAVETCVAIGSLIRPERSDLAESRLRQNLSCDDGHLVALK